MPEARFCRRCGASLRAPGPEGSTEQVSPQAATVPLREERRTTDELAPDEPRRSAPDTTRVSRAELEAILRRAAHAADPDATAYQPPGEETFRPDGRAPAPVAPPPAEEDLMRTRPGVSRDLGAPPPELDEEVTITVSRPLDGAAPPRRVEPIPDTGPIAETLIVPSPFGGGAAPQAPAAPPAAQGQRAERKAWPVVVALCGLLVAGAALGAWLVVRYLRRPPAEASAAPAPAPVTPDQRQLAEEKLIEAESLLASGDLGGSLALLREAVRLDPNNARAHRRLGDILRETGATREAIEELRAVVRLEPNDFTAWRSLAAAQHAEGLYAEEAESLRRLLELTGQSDPHDQLSYAEALNLAGRAEEARALLERLSSSGAADVAAAARQRLSDLASAAAAPTPAPTHEARPDADQQASAQTQAESAPTPQATPPPQATPQPTPQAAGAGLSPDERYRRGVELWGSNRAAAVSEFIAASRGGHPDAYYYLGLNLVEGRDLSTLKRAEVVSALAYFQNAQRGPHAAQSRRYAQQLEKEYDRIRSQQRQ